MTRINLIHPIFLTDQHLFAEIRELPRIFSLVRKHGVGFVPKNFCLGKGHVNFFRNKLNFLIHRYIELEKEYRRRGKNLNFTASDLFVKYYDLIGVQNGWPKYEPTIDDLVLSVNRLNEKIAMKPNWYKHTKWD
jgi:deoxyribonuclease (pyrimidine dimer)